MEAHIEEELWPTLTMASPFRRKGKGGGDEGAIDIDIADLIDACLLYTSPSPRDS